MTMAVEHGMVRLAARLPLTSDVGAIAAMLDRGPDGWEELAEASGVTLVGFLRENRFNVYAGGARVAPAVHT